MMLMTKYTCLLDSQTNGLLLIIDYCEMVMAGLSINGSPFLLLTQLMAPTLPFSLYWLPPPFLLVVPTCHFHG